MISGRLALGGLSIEFGNVEERAEIVSRRIEELSKSQARLMDQERELLDALARIYLPELSREAVSSGLKALRRQLSRALASRGEQRAELVDSVARADRTLDRHERALAAAEAHEAECAAALDRARERVEAELGTDPRYGGLVAEHCCAMERRELLRIRRSKLGALSVTERRRYESHPAYTYLHRRGFGSPDYAAGFVARRLDRWLARRIGFERLTLNHRILTAGPELIRQELVALAEQASALEASIDATEERVGARCGLMLAAETDAEAQRAVVDARSSLADARRTRDTLAAELRSVDANLGGPYEAAIEAHHRFLGEKNIQELEALARSTADPRDDSLVSDLARIRVQVEDVARKLAWQQREAQRLGGQAQKLSDLTRSAVARFSSRRSFFPDGFQVRDVVRNVLDGPATPDEAIEELEAAHTPRPMLVARAADTLDRWFAELSSAFDEELHATTVQDEHLPGEDTFESEVVVRGADGTVVHRRLTHRRGGNSTD